MQCVPATAVNALEDRTRHIVHITPHLGGGVGRVLLGYLARARTDSEFTHEVLSLDYANDEAQRASKETGFPLLDEMARSPDRLLEAISRAGVVLVHWWNHPLLYAFLVRETLPPARVVFWSHISGLGPPCVFSEAVLAYPDLFVFTSPLSLDTDEVRSVPGERRHALRVIWSTGGVEHVQSVRPRAHSGFNVGYIGTVDYSKLHPRFLGMCDSISLEGVRFIICGGPGERRIREQSLHCRHPDRFVFTGHVSDVREYLSSFDVFGYPLAPYHFGTCEQVLGESMAAGVPPVVMANKAESQIVEHGVTGMVASDEEAYVRAVEELGRNPELRHQLSRCAREAAIQKYSLSRMMEQWERTFVEMLSLPKTRREWRGRRRGKAVSPADLFIESLGSHGDVFLPCLDSRVAVREEGIGGIRSLYASSPLWRSSTRGTARHYHHFFPADGMLKLWSDLARQEDDPDEEKPV